MNNNLLRSVFAAACGLLFLVSATWAAEGGPAATGPRVVEPKEPPKVIMAKVGAEEITVQQMMKYLSKNPSLLPQSVTKEGKTKIVREMIIARLLGQALVKEGFLGSENATPQERAKAVSAQTRQHFPVPPTPADDALFEYYQAHLEEFGLPATVRLSQIQFRFPDKAGGEEKAATRVRAEGALKRLEAGEAFADVAGEVTENTRMKPAKGDLGFLPRNADQWLKKALDGLSKNQRTGILESSVGYEILLLVDEREAMISPFANVRDEVVRRMGMEAQIAARDAYARKLAEEVGVTILLPGLEGAKP